MRGADLSNWAVSWLTIADATSALNEVLPRPLKRGQVGREIPLFVECDFSGLSCPAFDPGIARFVRCRFEDVDVKLDLGTVHAHFEDCVFSGRWEGNFDARPLTSDPAKRAVVRGNDFTGCRDIGLQGGVDRTANTFDPSMHLVLWRGDPNWSRVREIAEEDVHLRNVIGSIEGHGPFDRGQDWDVLNRGLVADELWLRLRRAIGS
ncbi:MULTISPECIES: hypothetical protein [unclassified Modestobacter]|uniref:hypothetical protein n=1 Tax=unclassified Modestobacter TaxID=2643866 RepID=UPI0022AB2CC8|nr:MULTISPECIES: hypothetical protein [unclassified Modestobacter]MCZ2823562.1 hypothetical protein [Modestobacter sp. VKM Ac-2981]MCZ2851807.1 hypothetical protein [Modestobacter sp. VKM Ac-2982]